PKTLDMDGRVRLVASPRGGKRILPRGRANLTESTVGGPPSILPRSVPVAVPAVAVPRKVCAATGSVKTAREGMHVPPPTRLSSWHPPPFVSDARLSLLSLDVYLSSLRRSRPS